MTSGGRSVRSVVIARVLRYLTVKQQLPLSGGLPPSARMGHRRARLWALFQCCIPKAKAKTRKNLASAQVLEAERPEVRAAGGWARRIGLHLRSVAVVFHFVRRVVGPAGQGLLAFWAGSTPAG